MKHRIICVRAAAMLFWSSLVPLCAQSGIFGVIHSFQPNSSATNYINSDGAYPKAGLSLLSNALYGGTFSGGSGGTGTIFRVGTDGSAFTNIHVFTPDSNTGNTNTDGAGCTGLILPGNTLYGATFSGGILGSGTIFRVNTDGSDFTNLHSFTSLSSGADDNADGAGPWGNLVVFSNRLYGATRYGGILGEGVVFGINTDGSGFTNLANLGLANGGTPVSGLILAGQVLVGATLNGGGLGGGTVFKVNTDGSGFTNLFNFPGLSGNPQTTNSAGADPNALVSSGTTLFGVASAGGSAGFGTLFKMNTDGSGFTNLHIFGAAGSSSNNSANIDGQVPQGLFLSNGILYGTTQSGGSGGVGTIFSINTDGSGYTNLYSFPPLVGTSVTNASGIQPSSGVIMSGNALIGTASGGGAGGSGTVFEFTLVPNLSVVPVGSGLSISWPVWAANFTLQTASALAPGPWSNLTNGISNDGTNYYFTTATTNHAAFFRLSE